MHDCLGRHVYGPKAFQLIRDDDPWDIVTAFEALAEELLGGLLIPPTLDQNVEDMAVLDRRLARDNALTLDGQKDLIRQAAEARSSAESVPQ